MVSTGELVDKINHQNGKETWFFKEDTPTTASSVLLAVGPFEIYPDEVGFSENVSVTHFCLPGNREALAHSTKFLSAVGSGLCLSSHIQAFSFYTQFLKMDFPYKSYKQVFVEEPYSKICVGASLSIIRYAVYSHPDLTSSTHLLHTDKEIDQTFCTRRLLSLCLAQQWFGAFIGPASWKDTWIIFGLSGFLTLMFYQKMFGNNEYKFRIIDDMEYVMNSPNNRFVWSLSTLIHLHRPLYYNDYSSPQEFFTKLYYKKSTSIIYLLERHTGTNGFKKALTHILSETHHFHGPAAGFMSPGLRLSASTNAPTPPSGTKKKEAFVLATPQFLKLMKRITGFEMRGFADKWMYPYNPKHQRQSITIAFSLHSE